MSTDVIISIVLLWICMIPMGPLLSLSAFIHKRNIIFGVSFPKDVRQNRTIQELRKRYVRFLTILGFLVCIPITVLLIVIPLTEQWFARIYYIYIMLAMFGMIFYSQWLHGVYNKKLKVMKREEFGIIPVKLKPKAVASAEMITESMTVSNDWLLGLGITNNWAHRSSMGIATVYFIVIIGLMVGPLFFI